MERYDAKSIRLGYLVSRYPAASHTFILREVLALRQQGFQVEVASINAPDRPFELLTAEEQNEATSTYCVKRQSVLQVLHALLNAVTRHPLRFFGALGFALRLARMDVSKSLWLLFYFVEAAIVAEWMKRNSLTHLHVHFATPAASVALILSHLHPVTFSLTVHGPDEFYDVPGFFLKDKISAAKFVCAIGMYARSQLMKCSAAEHWEKFELTRLGVDPSSFMPRVLPISATCFEILCVGRLVPAKGQHVLLAALAVLKADGRAVHLTLIGDGPDRASLVEQTKLRNLEGSVTFEGVVNQDRIRAFYESADVFALASFAEGIPVALMEAMAMEIPCVTTWITGVPELISDGVDGLLIAPSDVHALADAIARLMDDLDLRKRIGQAGRRKVESHFELSRSVQNLADVFRRRLEVAA